ncbi:MAG TPA: haloacid dehalogenase type II [Acetobacteraceae bacterium]|jgi:2-haloacid dehalogenase|nr:haloacid dehalogenase type II [Acetobacteraceae bacterium]
MRLSDFRVLTFDCYGTLIDWESGLFAALQPLLSRANVTQSRDNILAAFADHESHQEAATPTMKYAALLTEVHGQLARVWGVAPDAAESAAFGASVGTWPAFDDTATALRYLKHHYKLVILSNVDRDSFAATLPRLGVTFDAVFTAQEIGSYKPDPRNFAYMLEKLAAMGVAKHETLHTAQSLFHDHAPANAAGLATAWIDRRQDSTGWGATSPPPAGARYDFRFPSLAAMATAHQAE